MEPAQIVMSVLLTHTVVTGPLGRAIIVLEENTLAGRRALTMIVRRSARSALQERNLVQVVIASGVILAKLAMLNQLRVTNAKLASMLPSRIVKARFKETNAQLAKRVHTHGLDGTFARHVKMESLRPFLL